MNQGKESSATNIRIVVHTCSEEQEWLYGQDDRPFDVASASEEEAWLLDKLIVLHMQQDH